MGEREQVKDFGRVADIYDATRALPAEDMLGVLAAISEVIPRDGLVVDVGVGTGRFAKPLQERGYRVVGIDVSKGMMAKAREKGVENLLFSDVRRIPFRDGAFESALLVHILHLVSDWTAVVREAARVSAGTVVAVIEREDGDNLGAVYRRARTARGYPIERFDHGERGLEEAVPPETRIRVLQASREGPAEDDILRFERREMSATWDVPEDVHGDIIRELRAAYGGKTLRWRATIDVVAWSPKDLREAFASQSQKG